MDLELWELLSYVVTVIGLPLAIIIFLYQERKERDNEEEQVYQLLSDNYQDFLKVALEHADLKLFADEATQNLSPEQRERMLIIFNMLISLFERAYLLLYAPTMFPAQRRRWLSWEDYMREWCRRSGFRDQFPTLLSGEDEDFQKYIRQLVKV